MRFWIGFGKLTKDDVKPIQNGKSKVINDKLIDNKNILSRQDSNQKDKNGKVQFKYDLNKFCILNMKEVLILILETHGRYEKTM